MKTYTTTEKLLLLGIISVLIAIGASIYFGVTTILQMHQAQVEMEEQTTFPEHDTDLNKEMDTSRELTQEEKMQILQSLPKQEQSLSKEQRIEIMQESVETEKDANDLNTEEKLEFLKQL